jgi:hypothetical protein
MLRAMSLVAQWQAIAARLPQGWRELRLRLRLDRKEDVARASALLGAMSPGRSADTINLLVDRHGAQGVGVLGRLLARLDDHGIPATLEEAAVEEAPMEEAAEAEAAGTRPASLAAAWNGLVAGLPDDWSDLLCLVELRSSDDLGRAALALAPLNPSRQGKAVAFRFRAARRFGYGAAPEMAHRCLERLDEAGIPGRLRLLEALADTRPLLTQGPVFIVDSRAV